MNLRVICFHLMVTLDYGASRKPPKNTLKKFVCSGFFTWLYVILNFEISPYFFYFNDDVFMKFWYLTTIRETGTIPLLIGWSVIEYDPPCEQLAWRARLHMKSQISVSIKRTSIKWSLNKVPKIISLNVLNYSKTDLNKRRSRSPFARSQRIIFYCLHLH